MKLVILIVIQKQHLVFSIHSGVKTGHCLINVIMCGNLKQKCYPKVYGWQDKSGENRSKCPAINTSIRLSQGFI